MATYITFENAIKNGDVKHRHIIPLMADATTDAAKMKLAQEYITYYESNDIGGNVENIYRMGAENSITHPKLFDLYIKEKGCKIAPLARLYLTLQNLIISATKQTMTYTLLKYGSWDKSREQVYSYYQKLYDIRHIFHVSTWYCARHMTGAATAEAKNVIAKGGDLAALRERLDSEFLDYRWSVVEYDKDWDHELDSIQCGSEKVSLVATKVPDVGSDFIKVSTGVTTVRHFILMYEYSESPKADCKQIMDTRNKVYVKLKNKFTDVASGPNMLSHGSCPTYIRSIAVKAAATQNKVCEVRAPKPGEYLENFYFFATGNCFLFFSEKSLK